jgi:subtilisin family serine protease
MKHIYILFISVSVLLACKKQEAVTRSVKEVSPLVPIDSINAIIFKSVRERGEFEWKQVDDKVLWSAIAHSGFLVSVGYKPVELATVENQIHRIQLQDPHWKEAKNKVLDLIIANEQTKGATLNRESMEVWQEKVLPVLTVEIRNFRTLQALRNSAGVRYVEPMEYETRLVEASEERATGCLPNDPDRGLISGVHYGVVSPFAKASWNYPDHGILDAWRLVSGKGIKVFLIDTGISYTQENLNGSFNQGFSSSRTLERLVTLPRRRFLGIINVGPPETPEDRCGHGTAMAGILAAPRGNDGNLAGIAYNSNLVTCRASEDVFIDAAREVKGVSDAFTEAGSRSDVKVISMSLGRITVSSQIRDAILYASGRGKLIFCAAGTSFSFTAGWAGVIFPASMPEVQAVTGVKQHSNFTACDECHSGPEVDFVVVMERAVDKSHPLTVADRGDDPSTIGGSSAATASMAAMTALVWSRHQHHSRDQILTLLQRYSSFYPQRHARWGWGKFQPALAVD